MKMGVKIKNEIKMACLREFREFREAHVAVWEAEGAVSPRGGGLEAAQGGTHAGVIFSKTKKGGEDGKEVRMKTILLLLPQGNSHPEHVRPSDVFELSTVNTARFMGLALAKSPVSLV